jgi:hypothetical protein
MMRSMSSPVQNYANHPQKVPVFVAVLIALILTVIGACVNVYQSWGDHQRMYSAWLILVLSVCAFTGFFVCRGFALKAQDRAIRAEENLRHFVMTGRLLDPRLKPLQIVALRFASDEEFVALAKQSAEQDTDPKSIKQAIRSWRADHHRA